MAKDNFNSILILKPGAIGDTLQLTPVIKQLKKAYPKSNISIVVGSKAIRGLFSTNPHIYKTFVYEKKGAHKNFGDFFKLCKELKKEHFDLVINFQRSNLRLWLLTLFLNPERILVYQKDEKKHAVVNHLETLKPLKIDINYDELELELFLNEDSENFADSFFEKNFLARKEVIALNLGASHKVNRWPVTKFAELVELIGKKLQRKIILVGGEEDKELNEKIKSLTNIELIDLAGSLSLLQLGAILKRCEAFVTGDTGPMHIATSVGTKVVALFGAADPKRTGPVGKGHIVIQKKEVKCVPCRKRVCYNKNYLECMEKIEPEDVLQFLR